MAGSEHTRVLRRLTWASLVTETLAAVACLAGALGYAAQKQWPFAIIHGALALFCSGFLVFDWMFWQARIAEHERRWERLERLRREYGEADPFVG